MAMDVHRFENNPLITPEDVSPTREDFEVICVFNAGAARFGDEIILLMRVAERPRNADPKIVRTPMLNCRCLVPEIEVLEFSREDPAFDFSDPRVICGPGVIYLTSISHLRVARSRDGRHFTIDEQPALAADRATEAFGLEDPRITEIEGTYYIIYKSVSPNGITQSLASTHDFRSFTKHGIIFPPENMDAVLFPQKIGGKYAALHRPFPRMIGEPSMWISYSNDLLYWGEHRFMAGVIPGGWEGGRIGAGAVPFMTERGWLEIYHGATPDHHYSLGAMLLDAERPDRVIARSKHPIITPESPYEVSGFVSNVVFTCGAIVDDDRITIYYGAADQVIAGAELSVEEILSSLDAGCK